MQPSLLWGRACSKLAVPGAGRDMDVEDAIELGRRSIYHATFRDAVSGGTVSGARGPASAQPGCACAYQERDFIPSYSFSTNVCACMSHVRHQHALSPPVYMLTVL